MKKYFLVIIAALFVTISCEDTNENLVQQRGVAVNVSMSDAIPAFFTDDLANTFVEFDLELPEGATVDKADLEVVFEDKKAIVKAIPSFPVAGMRVTAMELISALGISPSNVAVGDVFYIYVLTTKGETTTRSTAAMSINVTCTYNSALAAGTFAFQSASWGISGTTTIEVDTADPFKIFIDTAPMAIAHGSGIDATVATGNKMEININPNTFNTSGGNTVIATHTGTVWGATRYDNLAFRHIFGTFNSCNGQFELTFTVNVTQGNFSGSHPFTFRRISD